MSGHSKWSTIKRQKGAADAKRGQLFTKLSNAITIAVRDGGGVTDINSNFKLRLAYDRARESNMPKENIERAIGRAKARQGDGLEEIIYEGFAPGGVAVIILTVTDNKQRTFSELKSLFEKNGGTLGTPGSVSYLFTQKGEVVVKKDGKSFDDIFSVVEEAQVTDIEEENGSFILYCDSTSFSSVKKILDEKGIVVESSELIYKPTSFVSVDNKVTQDKIMNLLEKVEEMDDVQKVFTNVDFV